MVRAWYYDQPSKAVSLDHLAALGVLYWKIDADNWAGPVDKLCKERGYKNRDEVTISKEKFGDAFEGKMAIFFTEHLHDDEEIRFIRDGAGFFDVRDARDRWIRIHVVRGDLLILPAGIYHRFAPDWVPGPDGQSRLYAHAMRIFAEEPKWTPFNRESKEAPTDGRSSRQQWLSLIAKHAPPAADGVHEYQSPSGQAYILNDSAKGYAAYPHMREVNGFLFVSGLSSRRPDNTHQGVTKNADGTVSLDIKEQTLGCLSNLQAILAQRGATLNHVVDMQVFLTDMAHYCGMNEVYNQHYTPETGPTRTCVAVKALPHPNLLVELKAVAAVPRS